MKVTYGTERECAIGGNSTDAAYEVFWKIANTSGCDSDDYDDDATQYLGGGLSAYMDEDHLEITSPASDDLRTAVATERLIDKVQRTWVSKVDGAFTWKGNHFKNTTFGLHDNFVFREKARMLDTEDFIGHLALRQIVCGEGGVKERGQFYISPRSTFVYHAIAKDPRFHVYSWDNCSPHSTAIRLGYVPCIYGLMRLGVIKSLFNIPSAFRLGLEPHASIPDNVRKYAKELADLARLSRKHLGDRHMPGEDPAMGKMIDLWEAAAESVADGNPLPTIDWAAKWRAFKGADLSNAQLQQAMINWSRLDEEGTWYKIESRVIPDLPYWTRLSIPRDNKNVWNLTRRLPRGGVSLRRWDGGAVSDYDVLEIRGSISSQNDKTKLKNDRRCMFLRGRLTAKMGKIVSVNNDVATVQLNRTSKTVKAKPSDVFVY